MREILAFVFDLDGTIIDSTEILLKGLDYTLQPWKIEANEALIEDIRGQTTNDIFSKFNFSADEQMMAYQRLSTFFQQNYHQVPLCPRIEDLLTYLKMEQKRLALWTARDTASAELILKSKGLDHFFEFIVGNTGLKRNKPDPEGLKTIIEGMHLPAHQVVMIGDHDHDIIGGQSLGCKTIRVNWAKTTIPPTAQADWDFDSVNGFLALIKRESAK